jgi:hypothetical protein
LNSQAPRLSPARSVSEADTATLSDSPQPPPPPAGVPSSSPLPQNINDILRRSRDLRISSSRVRESVESTAFMPPMPSSSPLDQHGYSAQDIDYGESALAQPVRRFFARHEPSSAVDFEMQGALPYSSRGAVGGVKRNPPPPTTAAAVASAQRAAKLNDVYGNGARGTRRKGLSMAPLPGAPRPSAALSRASAAALHPRSLADFTDY